MRKTFKEIIQDIHDFQKERGWLGLDPGDLAKSIVIEAAELLEHFQWDASSKGKERNKEKIASEAADVFIYLMEFCDEMGIDILEATQKKLNYCDKKYPAKDIIEDNGDVYYKAKEEYRK